MQSNERIENARVRFAPSPTGALHIGGARTALFNYLVARASGGQFILRIDDTDLERSRTEYEEDIKAGLNWLGLSWDEGPEVGGPHAPYSQSQRLDRYNAAAKSLIEQNLAYLDHEGVVRLRYVDDEVVVEDLICGRCVFPTQSLGPEVVIVKSDGRPTYHLASVVDDIDMGITHIIRGQDHLTNTAKHMIMFRGLGAEPPVFAHLPLILGADGSKLSKRNSSGLTSLSDFRQAGYIPEAVINYLMLLGWSHPEAKEHLSLEDGIAAFSIERVGITAATFDMARLDWLNGWWMRHLEKGRLEALLGDFLGEFKESFLTIGKEYRGHIVEFISEQINFLTETEKMLSLIFSLSLPLSEKAEQALSESSFKSEVSQVLKAWTVLLRDIPVSDGRDCYSKEDFSSMLSMMKKTVKVEKKHIFQGLRLSIVGDLSGPELNELVPLISRNVILGRAEELSKRLA